MFFYSFLPSLRRTLVILSFLFASFVYSDLAQDTVYLSWQQCPDTTMTIQWIDNAEIKESSVYFTVSQEDKWQSVQGVTVSFPETPYYSIHRVELTQLQPNTSYQFKIRRHGQAYQFRTMPDQLKEPIRFVSGGDMYHDGLEFMEETSRRAAKTNPSFALIGGDIAYAVARSTSTQNIQKWIEWIVSWHRTMITPDGHLIPVIVAIGNHDVTGHFGQTPQQALIFSHLFPMPGSQIYNVLDFGTYLSLILLDSGHAHPIGGAQTDWLQNALEHRKHITHRFAAYHIPAYSSIRSFNNSYSFLIRKHWVPIFEKEGLELAFEHHDHAYKRTYPLINQKVNEKGVVYIGDGAWGVKHPRQPSWLRKKFYLAKLASARHFILVTVYPDKTSIESIDYRGQMIDEYTHLQPMAPENIESDSQFIELKN